MRIDTASFNELTHEILSGAIEVHRTLGPGLLESIYSACLQYELATRNLRFVVQRTVPIRYETLTLDASYPIDLIVEDLVVVEVKSVAMLKRVSQRRSARL